MACQAPAMRWTREITPAQVLQLIRAEPDPRKALLIFDSATAEYPSGFRHDIPTFSLMATRLATAGLFSAAESLLERVPSEIGRPPSEAPFLVLLRAYGRAHRPLDALRLFRQAPTRFHLHPSHRSYTALLAVLVAENRLALARGLYNHMREAGVPPTVASYNVLLKALCSATTSGGSAAAGSIDAALRVFGRMADRGCPPDSCSYNTLIDGLCKIGRVEEARELFRQMDSNGCSPTVVTYTTLIHGLCRTDRLEEALKMFDEMGQRGVDPNIITYSSLVDGLCKGGRSLKAMVLLDQMGAECCLPNTITYSSIIHGLCTEGRLREAVEVLDRMRLHGRKPDAGLYGKLIKGLCDSGRFQEAANYLDEMVLSGISPNRVTWSLHMRIHNMVVVGLCTKNESTRAFQVYQSMRTRSISTEPEAFHFLVECFCKKGDVHKAARIVSEMLLEGCVPYQDTWRTIMGGYWERRKVRKAAELVWDQLVVD